MGGVDGHRGARPGLPVVDLLAGARWRCVATQPGSVTDPTELGESLGRWLPTEVPGTAAGAIRAADGPAAARSASTDADDWWFVTEVARVGRGPWRLELDGLATHAQVWVGGELVASTESMFVPVAVDCDLLAETFTLAIRFASLDEILRQRRPRGRWRSSLIRAQGLRWIRTSLLGRAPVFTGVPAPVGPWRAVRMLDSATHSVIDRSIRTSVDGGRGVLDLRVTLAGAPAESAGATVQVGDTLTEVALEPGEAGTYHVSARLVIPEVRLWWPHTHGAPELYPVSITVARQQIDLGAVGFRTVTADRSDGGFALAVNGAEMFCRGAVWAPADPVGLTDRAATRATLDRCVDAGLNMIRIPGTMVYEDHAFWQDCAELGMMVWQDAMLATVDPPDTPEFQELLASEITALLREIGGNPSLIVLSGGSETQQQPAMLGLPRQPIAVLDELIPALVAAHAPGVVSVSSTPCAPADSDKPAFHVGTGIAHYFGVGGYRLPLSNVRSAGVRFAAECLAFSVPPSDEAIEAEFGSLAVAGHHPRWKAAVPRDNGASWDFEDVRDHYVRTLFGEDPATVRWSDPQRYLDLGRAAICEAVRESVSFWRRPDSGCGGALLLTLRDLEPGAGWGLLDDSGNPKAPWFVLRRLSQPIAVAISDDGLDGVRIDVFNDTAAVVTGHLRVQAHTRAGLCSIDESAPVTLPARSGRNWPLDSVLGRFTDLSHVYKFGARAFASVTVTLTDDGALLAEDVYLVGGCAVPVERAVGLTAVARQSATGQWCVDIGTDGAAQYVSLDLRGFEPADSWFHLPPGGTRTVPVRRIGTSEMVTGRVKALNSLASAAVLTA